MVGGGVTRRGSVVVTSVVIRGREVSGGGRAQAAGPGGAIAGLADSGRVGDMWAGHSGGLRQLPTASPRSAGPRGGGDRAAAHRTTALQQNVNKENQNNNNNSSSRAQVNHTRAEESVPNRMRQKINTEKQHVTFKKNGQREKTARKKKA